MEVVSATEGWELEQGGRFEIMDSGHRGVDATDGENTLDMESGPNMSISQRVLGLENGDSYELSFDTINTEGRTDNGLDVYWNGEKVGEVGSVSDSHAVTLMAGSGDGSNTLRFVGTDAQADYVGLALDNVRMEQLFDAVYGNEDQAIDLFLDTSSLAELSGDSTVTNVLITDVPDDATLSTGTNNGDGTWSLQPDDLDGLQITPSQDFHGEFELGVELTIEKGVKQVDFSSEIQIHGGTSQDKHGEYEVQDDGVTLFMSENGWKSVPGEFTITENTIVELEYKSTELPELVSIGFDNDSRWNNGTRNSDFFKIFGHQTHGDAAQNAFEVYDGNGEYQKIRIPVGEYMTGDYDRMTFINDDDQANAQGIEGNSYFRNVRVFESDEINTSTLHSTLTVEVASVNDAVDGLVLSNASIEENSPAGTVIGVLSATDVDTEDTHKFEFVDATGSLVEDAKFEIVDNEIRVKDSATLNYENSSTHQIHVRVTDAAGTQHIEQFDIEIVDVNEGQIAHGESFTIAEDGSISGNLLDNDSDLDGDALSIESFEQPESGTVTVEADGNFSYQPNEDFSGRDSFSYTLTDGNGQTSTQTVELQVDAVADGASVVIQDSVGNEDQAIDLSINASLADIDGSERISSVLIGNVPDGATLSAGTNNGDGSWSLNADQLEGLQITPPENSHGSFDLTIDVTTLDGTEIDIVNPGFQVDDVADTRWTNGNGFSGWERIGSVGTWDPTVSHYSEIDTDEQVVWANAYSNGESGLGQTLNENFDSSKNYELSVDIGNRYDSRSLDSSYEVRLIAGDSIVGAMSGSTGEIADGTFENFNFQIEGEQFESLNGTPLRIEILNTGSENSGIGQVNFDNVRLVTTSDATNVATVSHSLTVDVQPVNDAITDVSISNAHIAENAPAGTIVGALSAVDVDSGESFTYEFVDDEGNVIEDANFEIVDASVVVRDGANLDFEGQDEHTLNIRVTDSGGTTHTEEFTFEVSNVNEGQVTQGESFSLNEDGSLTGNLLANDVDLDGDTLTIESFEQPENGTVAVDADGNFTYQPNENFSGQDSFTYTMTDSNGETSTQTVELQVDAVADAVALAAENVSGNEDEAIDLPIDASLIDVDGSEQITSIVISDVPGGATLSAGMDNGDGTWSLEPADLDGLQITPTENSTDDFEIGIAVTTVDGDSTAVVNQTLQVQVAAVNDAVTDVAISNASIAENAPAGTIVGALSAVDVDSGESFTYEFVDDDGNVIQDTNFEIADGNVVVRQGADLNFETQDTHKLNIRVTDSGGTTHTEEFTFEVTDVNEGQVTQGESFSLNEDGSLTGNLLANDVDLDGDTLTIESFEQPENGTVAVDADGNFTYQPNENFSGQDSFTYTMTDSNGETSTQTVELQVDAVADAVALAAENVSGNEDEAIDLPIDASLIDVDGSEQINSIVISDVPEGATLSAGMDNGDGTWSLEPADLDGLQITPAENSTDDFEIGIAVTTVDGDSTAVVNQTLQVQVAAVNDAVTDVAISNASIAENAPAGTIVGTLSSVDADAGETFTYEFVDDDGNVIQDTNFEIADGNVVVRQGADLNFETQDTHKLNIRVTDSGGTTHTEEFTFEVTDVNEGQVTQGESFSLNEDGSLTGNLLANDVDLDGDTLTIESFEQPENGTIAVDADGNFTYQPNENFSGQDSFTYTMTDSNGETSTQTVELQVDAVADAADLAAQNAQGNEDQAIDLKVDANLLDVDGSERISHFRILRMPPNAELNAGVNNGDGSWTLESSELEDLQLKLSGLGNEDFELDIEVTTVDGESTQVRTQTVEVQLDKDTLAILLSDELDQIESPTIALEGDVNQITEIEQSAAVGIVEDDGFNFEALYNEVNDLSGNLAEFNSADIWNQPEFDSLSQEFSNENASENIVPAASIDEMANLAIETIEIPDRNELGMGELVEFDQLELHDVPIQIERFDEMEELDSSNLTTASLLMMFTKREDSRKKLLEFESRRKNRSERV